MRRNGWAARLGCLGVLIVASCAEAPQQSVDAILFNGKIITVDANDSIFESLAVREGRILALGTSEEIEKLAGFQTERIDL